MLASVMKKPGMPDAENPQEDAAEGYQEEPGEVEQESPEEDATETGEDGEQASPEEQAQYNDIVIGAMTIMYQNPATAKDIANKIASEADSKGLAVAIGQQVGTIMLSVTRGMKQKGAQLDPDVVLNAGVEVLAEVAEICQRAGLLKPEESDDVIRDAGYEATRFYGDSEQRAGEISPETQQQAKQVMAQAQQAQQGQPPAPPSPSLADMAGGQ